MAVIEADTSAPTTPRTRVDVLIVGAGISGVGAAVHLQKLCPGTTFAIVEQRPRPGGTWDLFRYPGVRSDSDMHTLGFSFKPWTAAKSIADGPSIREYVIDTIREHDLERHIRFEHRVVRSSFSSATGRWTVEITHGSTPAIFDAQFLFLCAGYYRYDQGYLPEWPGYPNYRGTLIHPQHWPEDFDPSGKRIVVIGSGATAMTLVPALAERGAAKVTMLQRSPTYVVSQPSEDKLANLLRRALPDRTAYAITRWKNVHLQSFVFKLARNKPEVMKKRLLDGVTKGLGESYDVATHFTPRYNPWEQRLCLIPDDDLYDAIKSGTAEVVTDTIDRFTEHGIQLSSGTHLDAEVVVTATGLNIQMLGGMETVVDGVVRHPGDSYLHKGIMLSDIPNLGMWFGYTNASWTLKADLTSEYFCRLINHMRQHSRSVVVPVAPANLDPEPFADFSSGYLARAHDLMPKQGADLPWKLHQNYFKDVKLLRRGDMNDPALHFSNPTGHPAPMLATTAS
jgi:monooxygenase